MSVSVDAKAALNIRQFEKGVDEPVWVEVLNAAYREHEDWWRATTVEELLLEEKQPSFDLEGRFIAELDRKPVGVIHAQVEKERKEKKGFISIFGVIPEFRGLGVEEKLADLAIHEFRRRGMKSVQAWTDFGREDRVELLRNLGFRLVRSESDMEIDLAEIPADIGENKQVTIRSLRKDAEDEIRMLNWLENECFRGHSDHRPATVEETRLSLLDNPKLKEQEYSFAILNRQSVGYIGVGIDEKYNIEKKVRAGFVLGIGVLKPYRRKGIGTRLILHGLEMLKAKGMTKARLDVDDANPTKAIRLYEKIGFQPTKKWGIYERSL